MSDHCPKCGAPAGPSAPDGDFRYQPPPDRFAAGVQAERARCAEIAHAEMELHQRFNAEGIKEAPYCILTAAQIRHDIDQGVDMSALTAMPGQWRPLDFNDTEGRPPFDGKPVLIATNHTWCNRVHRVIWTDAVHGKGIFGWAVEDCKFGPYPLRGYTMITYWQPLPAAPVEAGSACLNNPTLSARDRAFEVARQALRLIPRMMNIETAHGIADKALADIAALLGDAK